MKPEIFQAPTSEKGTPPSENTSELGDVYNKLQLSLMPIAFQKRHPGIEIDLTNSTLRQEMATEWVSHYAEPFGTYVKTHEHEMINLSDPEALSAFLENLSPDSSTLH